CSSKPCSAATRRLRPLIPPRYECIANTRHLFWAAAVRLFPAAIPFREVRDCAATAARTGRRDRVLLSRQRPRPARNADRTSAPQVRRAAVAELRLRKQASAEVLSTLPETNPGRL